MAEFPRGFAVREQALRRDSSRKHQSDIKTLRKSLKFLVMYKQCL